MRQFVEDFFRTYDTCCRAKMPRHHPYGLLEPLPIPSKPWQCIALDFITDLPISKGFNAILTVVYRYTCHVLRKSPVKKPQKLSCVKYVGIMASPIVSSAIMDPNSYRNSRSTFLICSKSLVTSPPATTHKPLAKQNEQIKRWSSIFDAF